ncbi:MAG: riboflavin synthase [Elusimicrobia bacterium]|nr:riboflavin synthase [Elusimicrobiota bacterium]
MFTGLAKDLGRVVRIGGGKILIKTSLEGIEEGDSVMVDGVCLTASEVKPGSVCMDVGTETLKVTALGTLRAGSRVNLEDSLTLSSKLGGHIVYGHVMEVGRIISRRRMKNTIIFRIKAPKSFTDKLITKGSVSVNGVSLTVNRVDKNFFEVGLIPETLARTNLGNVRMVNLEADMLIMGGRG